MTWVDRNARCNGIGVRYGDATAPLLPRRYWYFEDGGRGFHVRDPHCEELYRTYVVPRRKAGLEQR